MLNYKKAVQEKFRGFFGNRYSNTDKDVEKGLSLSEKKLMDRLNYEAKRMAQIVCLRKDYNYSLAKIGSSLKPRVSRERVRQLVEQYASEEEKLLFGYFKKDKKVVFIPCVVCGVTRRVYKPSPEKRETFKCKKHMHGEKKTPEQKREAMRLYARKRYAESADVRKRQLEATMKWRDKLKKDPLMYARYRELQNRAVRDYYRRKKEKQSKAIPN